MRWLEQTENLTIVNDSQTAIHAMTQLDTASGEDLTLNDLYLQQRRILIRQGKGLKDRTIYLTEAAAAALEVYIDVRGPGNSSHLFLYRNKPMSKDLVRSRLKGASKRTGVKVTPHMLRHTFGTQLVNAGCRITTIQMLLGHQPIIKLTIFLNRHSPLKRPSRS